MSDKSILLLKLNEQIENFKQQMDKFAKISTKAIEEFGNFADETNVINAQTIEPDSDTVSRQSEPYHNSCGNRAEDCRKGVEKGESG